MGIEDIVGTCPTADDVRHALANDVPIVHRMVLESMQTVIQPDYGIREREAIVRGFANFGVGFASVVGSYAGAREYYGECGADVLAYAADMTKQIAKFLKNAPRLASAKREAYTQKVAASFDEQAASIRSNRSGDVFDYGRTTPKTYANNAISRISSIRVDVFRY